MSALTAALKLGVAGAAAAACIYFPQPLAARIQSSFGLSAFWGAMPMTLAFIVLTGGPVLFGRWITLARALRIVVATELLLALLFALQAFAGDATVYFILRGLQTLLLPLLIPAVLTASSSIAASNNRARDLAFYTAGTIVGGVLGRLVALAAVAFENWQLGSLAITALLLASAALLRRPPALGGELERSGARPATSTAPPPASAATRGWRTPVALAYPGLALGFATLTAILTCLPFEVGYEGGGTALLALVYGGYGVGIATSLGAPWLTRLAGGLSRATPIAAGLFVAGVVGVYWPGFASLVAGVVLLCASMVFQQATQIVLLNEHFGRAKSGTVNALFVAAIFAGGTLGSSAMVGLYEVLGWHAVMAACLLFAAAAGYCVSRAARQHARMAAAVA